MKTEHFEQFQPICPVCLYQAGAHHRLQIHHTEVRVDNNIVEGALKCSHSECHSEFPIIDGVPLIVPNLRAFIADNLLSITARGDLSARTMSLIGDCSGQGSHFGTMRQHLSCYAWDHYGDCDPEEVELHNSSGNGSAKPGSALRVLSQCFLLCDQPKTGHFLDLGCSVGRTTFEIAKQTNGLVLGIDLHYPMLHMASQVLQRQHVEYDRRRVGVVYDRRSFPLEIPDAQRVDFWLCNASVLPLPSHCFDAAFALNLLDCISSPADLIRNLNRVLQPGSPLFLSTPYDWSENTTPINEWIGGHSQRDESNGDPAALMPSWLRRLQSQFPELQLCLERELDSIPWTVRLHERSHIEYLVHVMQLRKHASALR